MRFNKLHLIAYGKFTDYKIDFEENKNFHLIYGDNEKGKSTISVASADLLYGIDKNTNYAFKHNNNKLRIAAELKHSDGEKLYFKRKKGNKDTMLDDRDIPIKDTLLVKYLNNIDRITYSNLFGLSYESLVGGGEKLVKNCKNIGSSLIQATSGISNIDEISKVFENKQNQLFKKRGKSDIKDSLDEFKDINKRKDESTLYTYRWKEIENNFKYKKEQVDKINKEIEEINLRLNKLKRIKLTLPKIISLIQKEKELEEYKEIQSISEDTILARKDYSRTVESIKKELNTITSTIIELRDEISNINFNSEILKHEKEIADLYKMMEVYKSKLLEIASLSFEIDTLDKDKKRHLESMGIEETDDKALKKLRINVMTKEKIKELSENYKELSSSIKALQRELIELKEELEDLKVQEEKLGDVMETSELEMTIESAKKEVHLIKYIEDLKGQLKNILEKNEDDLKELVFWNGSKEELYNLKLPLKTTISDYNLRFKDLNDKIKANSLKLSEKENELKLEKDKLQEIENLENVVTEEKLLDIRSDRDTLWKSIVHSIYPVFYGDADIKAIQGIKDIKEPIDLFPTKLKESDSAADNMIKNQKELAERKSISQRIQKIEDEIEDINNNSNSLDAENSSLLEEWINQWKESGITNPLTPVEMLEWTGNFEKLKDSLSREKEIRNEIHFKEEKIQKQTEKVKEGLNKFKYVVNNEDSLEDLIGKASKVLKEVDDAQRELKYIRKEKTNKEAIIKTKEKVFETEENLLKKWEEMWKEAMNDIGKNPTSISSEAEKYVEMIDKLFQFIDLREVQYQKLKNEKEYKEQYEKRVSDLVKELSFMNLKNDPFVIEDLNKYLMEEIKNKNTKELKSEELEKSLEKEKKLKKDYNYAYEMLQNIFKGYNCTNTEEMEEIENKSLKKSEIIKILEELKSDILHLGEGKGIEELIQESQSCDIDEAKIEIVRIEEDIKLLGQQREALMKEYVLIEKEYNDIGYGNSAVAAEITQQESEVCSLIADNTVEYFKNLLATKLLKKAIEKYRQDNEYQIISRAAEIFKEITGGSFKGIEIQYDEQDTPYIAGVRNDDEGSTVTIEGMSKGTVDQLYLALRIAGIERYIKTAEPIPLIFDDIVINYDDDRSKKTIEVLSNLSKNVQVIYLTHHSRIVEITQELLHDEIIQVHKL